MIDWFDFIHPRQLFKAYKKFKMNFPRGNMSNNEVSHAPRCDFDEGVMVMVGVKNGLGRDFGKK